MIEFIDETAEKGGTPLNRANLMGIQGFVASTTIFGEDGSITETSPNGHTLVTQFNDDGTVTETFTGEKVIIKTTYFNDDGSVREVIS